MNSAPLSGLYTPSLALVTDLYQLTMAYGYWRQGLQDREAVFHLYFRKPPFQGGYAVAAGLALAVDWLEHLRFSDDDLAYLGSLRGSKDAALFPQEFLEYLHQLRFTCDIDAVAEGTGDRTRARVRSADLRALARGRMRAGDHRAARACLAEAVALGSPGGARARDRALTLLLRVPVARALLGRRDPYRR